MANAGWYLTVPGVLAGADLSSSQYKIVKYASTAGEVVVAAAATDNLLGVLQNAPTDGQPAEVAVLGIAKVLCESSVAVTSWITSSTTGRAKATTTANDDVLGKLITASSATAGEVQDIFLSGVSNY